MQCILASCLEALGEEGHVVVPNARGLVALELPPLGPTPVPAVDLLLVKGGVGGVGGVGGDNHGHSEPFKQGSLRLIGGN